MVTIMRLLECTKTKQEEIIWNVLLINGQNADVTILWLTKWNIADSLRADAAYVSPAARMGHEYAKIWFL